MVGNSLGPRLCLPSSGNAALTRVRPRNKEARGREERCPSTTHLGDPDSPEVRGAQCGPCAESEHTCLIWGVPCVTALDVGLYVTRVHPVIYQPDGSRGVPFPPHADRGSTLGKRSAADPGAGSPGSVLSVRDANGSHNMNQQERDAYQALHPLRSPRPPGGSEAGCTAAAGPQAGTGLALVPQRNLPAVTGQRPPGACESGCSFERETEAAQGGGRGPRSQD